MAGSCCSGSGSDSDSDSARIQPMVSANGSHDFSNAHNRNIKRPHTNVVSCRGKYIHARITKHVSMNTSKNQNRTNRTRNNCKLSLWRKE